MSSLRERIERGEGGVKLNRKDRKGIKECQAKEKGYREDKRGSS